MFPGYSLDSLETITGGAAGPSESGSIRGGDLALGGINLGTQTGGIPTAQVLIYAGLAVAAFMVWKKFK